MASRFLPERITIEEIAIKVLGALIALMAFCGPSLAQGETLYIISLKNGGEFKTSYYWEEGHEIRFYIHGGVIGIIKDAVKTIQKRKGFIAIPIEHTDQDMIAESKVSRQETHRIQDPLKSSIAIDRYQAKRADLREKLEDAIKRHSEATEKKDLEAKEVAWKEMVDVNGALTELVEEVKERHNGVLPGWWFEQVSGRP